MLKFIDPSTDKVSEKWKMMTRDEHWKFNPEFSGRVKKKSRLSQMSLKS